MYFRSDETSGGFSQSTCIITFFCSLLKIKIQLICCFDQVLFQHKNQFLFNLTFQLCVVGRSFMFHQDVVLQKKN